MATSQSPVVSEIQRLIDNEGRVRHQAIVDAARPEESPLHGYFRWDDEDAGERYRLIQAAHLVRRVRVHLIMPTSDIRRIEVNVVRLASPPRSVRWLHAPRGSRGNGYLAVDRIASDDVLATDMVDTLRGELIGWVSRAQGYVDAAAGVGRDEVQLQSVISAVAEVVNRAWPSELSDGRDGGDGDIASVSTP